MRRIWTTFIVIALGLFASATFARAADLPWERDGALLDQFFAAAQTDGIMAAAPHVAAFDKALTEAKTLLPGPVERGGTRYVLTDGPVETTAVLMMQVTGNGNDVVAVPNPYPLIGRILGAYYVEIGRFEEALDALDAGLALSPLPEEHFGWTVPDLLAERGIALGQLKRWKEALASYEAGLAIGDMDKGERALLHRGRGFVLVELGRIEEAEAAYRTSLELEPGNSIAIGELAYIAKLKAGAEPVDPNLVIRGTGEK